MKRTRKTALSAVCVLAVSVFLAGCKGESTLDENPLLNSGSGSSASASIAQSGVIHNFEMPQIGEKIAVIKVKDYGEIKIKLFPELVPNGSENFSGLAEKGYYNELIFHRIIKNFMNQGGDPRGDGTGGKSLWGEKFAGEVGEGLYHFSGAVAYAHGAYDFDNGSQFYIVNTPEGYSSPSCEELMSYAPDEYIWPQNVIDMYKEKGGTPSLDGNYTVFGQVFEGMDVVREMGKVETDENDKPLKQVMMESVEIVEYAG